MDGVCEHMVQVQMLQFVMAQGLFDIANFIDEAFVLFHAGSSCEYIWKHKFVSH